MKILGIDPGLRTTGFGVIDKQGSKLTYIASGTIKTPDADLPQRLKVILAGVSEVIKTYAPDCSAIEKVFVNVNPQSTLKLGQARGAVLLAIAMQGIAIGEYAARLIKKAVVGTGAAEKAQVHAMVARLLPGVKIVGADASDALAVAITHAHHLASQRRVPKA